MLENKQTLFIQGRKAENKGGEKGERVWNRGHSETRMKSLMQ